MLRELRIRNYAVIRELSLRLEPRLNVVTGETGAGKSIIVDALSLALGERASADVIRAGEERAMVEAAFDIAGRPDLLAICRDRGIEVEDGWLVLRREIQAEGRNRGWINDSPSTAALMSELGRALVDLHGQHEHQALLHAGPQREILDSYGETAELVGEVATHHRELQDLRARRAELVERRARTEERADLLRHQQREIEAAAIQTADEDERLIAEERRLSHAEELLERTERLYQALYASDESALDRLGGARRDLEALAEVDPDLGVALLELYETASSAVQELGERLGSYRNDVELDPRRLERVRQRLDLLYRLKSKYGPGLEEVRRTGDAARAELQLLDSADLELGELDRRETELADRLSEAAGRLSAGRTEAARALADEISGLLPDLGMSGARFEIALEPRAHIEATGAEAVEFRVAVNRGFEPRPLARVASGGELSRIMLALKSVLADLDRTPTLIFDEIDAGIGGIVAQRVAEKLASVADHHQVFVITHLPQIAALADHHLLVTKRAEDERAAAEVTALEGEARVRDLARMLGGDPDREASIEHARAILEQGGAARRPRPGGPGKRTGRRAGSGAPARS